MDAEGAEETKKVAEGGLKVITVINTKKAAFQDLSAREIESQLIAAGLSEFIDIYVDHVNLLNNLSSVLSTQYWILGQPGVAVTVGVGSDITLPASLPEAETDRVLPEGLSTKIISWQNIPPKLKLGTLSDQIRYYGVENILWKYKEFNQEDIVIFDRPAPDWFLARGRVHDSIGARLILASSLFPAAREGRGGLGALVDDETADSNKEEVKSGGLTGDQVKTLAAIGIVNQTYMSALTILMCINQYDIFLRGKPLTMPPVDNTPNVYFARLTHEAYVNWLTAILRSLKIVPKGPVTTMAALDITDKERKLLESKIASNRARRQADIANACEHLSVAAAVAAGNAPVAQKMAFCGPIVDGQVMCNVCGSILMCEHEMAYNMGGSIAKFQVETDKVTYCGNCGEQLSVNFLDVPIPQVEFDRDTINIIMYQYSIMKKQLIMPITLNERMLSRALTSGIYEDVSASINLINHMRGISEVERIDRIYLQTYVYVWVYILYLIALYKLDIKILDIGAKKGDKGGGLAAKSAGDKIVRIIQADMRNILSKNPSINVMTMFQKALKNYFSGTKPGEDMMKKESGALIHIRIMNDPFVNQNQLHEPIEGGRTKLFEYAAKAIETPLEVRKTEGTSSMILIWPPMPKEYVEEDARIKIRTYKARINPLWRVTSPWSTEFAMKKIPNLPFVNLGERKRKISKIVYEVGKKKIDDAKQMPVGAVIVDLLDQDGRSMYELLEPPYEFKAASKMFILASGAPKKIEEKAAPHISLDDEYDKGIEGPLRYLGAGRGAEYPKILNGTLSQVYNLSRLSVIVGYLSTYTAPEKKGEKVGDFIEAVIRRDGVAGGPIEKICITGINLIHKYTSPKTIERIIDIESRLAKPEVTSASLLRAYLSRNQAETEEPMDADALIPEKEISDDAYANIDYDGQNDD